ncbi:unnamed protein product [Prunus armeniaca]|uniref:Uncharacterized protein n=1 Tax=Prunus armeniaca TaxID=36596 RepID=A0A6J5VFG8_PRUAR|nr:unnamed protein product [Prunus armeniaca]CAB4317010.1 unnamed protein product [Prunus armeniaca]
MMISIIIDRVKNLSKAWLSSNNSSDVFRHPVHNQQEGLSSMMISIIIPIDSSDQVLSRMCPASNSTAIRVHNSLERRRGNPRVL